MWTPLGLEHLLSSEGALELQVQEGVYYYSTSAHLSLMQIGTKSSSSHAQVTRRKPSQRLILVGHGLGCIGAVAIGCGQERLRLAVGCTGCYLFGLAW